MAFDGLFTTAMTEELQQLVTGRIAKIHQPNAQEIVMHIRANSNNYKLLFSIHSAYARVQITTQTIDNPAEPPMFCTLLRKHLEGGVIAAITQEDGDRIITFDINATNEIGDPVKRIVSAEIMGRHSNVLLIDAQTNKIIDSLKHLPPAVNSYRTVMPGAAYIAPPAQEKANPFTTSADDVAAFFVRPREAKEVQQHFAGFSTMHAQELLHRIGDGDALTAWQQFLQQLRNAHAPTYCEVGNKVLFSPTTITHVAEAAENFTSLGSLLDRVFFARAERDRVKQQAGDLERWLQNERDKLQLKMRKLEQDYARAEKLDTLQLYGELLMANIYAFSKGETSVTVANYYSEVGEMVTIPLNPRKTPVENAQHYYTRYTKAKNALIMVKQQLEKTATDLTYFELLAQQVQHASPSDIEEIREELAEQGLLRLRASKKKKKVTKPAPESYTSSTGIAISVGKNNKQNDFLTFKLAKRHETWLHTKDIPGSHVVIHSDAPDEQTLAEAAVLSAYFSKARESSAVPVDYTEVRHVKKPNGAKPGFVIYFEQKTLFVTPDETVVMQLKQK
ncbi:MAG: NFACT RNA binding domain-containing protein [Caryophanon sp.]|nr:NFACT RNA binding domain-containing protein [Caryophanon sp.]